MTEQKRVFTYQAHNNIDKHKVVLVDAKQAEEIVNSGKGVHLDMAKLSQFESEASRLHAEYKRNVDAIKNNDDPRVTEEVVAWELGKLKDKYDADAKQLDADYQAFRKSEQQAAKEAAAKAVVKVSKNDEQVASQFVTRASLDLATASDDDKSGIVRQVAKDIAYLSDGEKTALQANIGGLLNGLTQTDKNILVEAVKDVRDPAILSYKIAQQLPVDILTEKRRTEILKKVVAESQFSQEKGGIDREFYEEYLKEGSDK